MGAAGQRWQPAHQQRHPERRARASSSTRSRGTSGIPIHHYIQVDFAGFQELVDVVDGVQVYFANPARDSRSGLDIEETGCVTLDGQQALSYVRSRHFQVYEDGRWRSDGSADLGRISRQQDFIVRALRRAVDQGVRNPVTLDRLVNAGLDTVTVDDLLTADDIIDLGAGLPRASTRARSTCTRSRSCRATSAARRSSGCVDEQAQPTLDRFRGTDTGDLRPADVRVRVLNGSGITGQAGQAGDDLAAVGFGAAGTGEAERFDVTETLVRYTAGGEAKADLVARYLDPSARLELVDGPARGRRRRRHRQPVRRGADRRRARRARRRRPPPTTSTATTRPRRPTPDARRPPPPRSWASCPRCPPGVDC